MAKLGNRKFKKSQQRTFTEIRNGQLVRVTVSSIKGQKLRDRMESIEIFQPIQLLAKIPGTWSGTWVSTTRPAAGSR